MKLINIFFIVSYLHIELCHVLGERGYKQATIKFPFLIVFSSRLKGIITVGGGGLLCFSMTYYRIAVLKPVSVRCTKVMVVFRRE